MIKRSTLFSWLCALCLVGCVSRDGSFSRLGPDAAPVTGIEDDELRREAPDYRVLRPFYVGQATPASCSVASIAMVVNAALLRSGRSAALPLDENTLLAAVGDRRWQQATQETGQGVSFRQFTAYLQKTLEAFGFPNAEVQVFIPTDRSAFTRWRMREFFATLGEGDFILAAFDQGAVTGGEHVGHISPLAAFDAEHDRVLIMDVDRQWYPAYWSKADTFLDALLQPDPADPNDPNGLVRIRIPAAGATLARGPAEMPRPSESLLFR